MSDIREDFPDVLRAILAGGILFMLYAFAVFCVVVCLIGGISDLVFQSRKVAAEEAWAAESAAEGREFTRTDYTANLVTGFACLAVFPLASLLLVMMFRRRFGNGMHIVLVAVTLLLLFILLLPRPELGTGTAKMKEVFAYLALLGVFESALFRTYAYRESSVPEA